MLAFKKLKSDDKLEKILGCWNLFAFLCFMLSIGLVFFTKIGLIPLIYSSVVLLMTSDSNEDKKNHAGTFSHFKGLANIPFTVKNSVATISLGVLFITVILNLISALTISNSINNGEKVSYLLQIINPYFTYMPIFGLFLMLNLLFDLAEPQMSIELSRKVPFTILKEVNHVTDITDRERTIFLDLCETQINKKGYLNKGEFYDAYTQIYKRIENRRKSEYLTIKSKEYEEVVKKGYR